MAASITTGEQYSEYYGSDDLAAWRRLGAVDKATNIIDLCAALKPQRVLDVGCGDGAIIARLSELNFAPEYRGVDISSSAIAAAGRRRLSNAQFEVFDGSKLPFGDDSFDLVVISHVVEHLEHPRMLLAEAKRVSRFVFVEVPCEHNARLPLDYKPDPVGHINYYTPTTIRRLSQTCGLKVSNQLTRNVSLAVMRYPRPVLGYAQYAVRAAALAVAPSLATALFCYHSALLCERE